MRVRRLAILGLAVILIAAVLFAGYAAAQNDIPVPVDDTRLAELGEFLYFDENLSHPDGQSCASCHLPEVGFDDPDSDLPVSEGVLPNHFGGRNSPMSAYAMYAPSLYFDDVEGLFIGGQFWDGRATGYELGDPLADQAIGPPLNPVEMANPNEWTYIRDIKRSDYAHLFRKVWGSNALSDVETAYDQAGLSVAAFERTALFAQFSSKYDAYLDACVKDHGKIKLSDLNDCAQGIGPKAAKAAQKILTDQEWYGLQLFMGENNNDGMLEPGEGAFCSACHVANWTTAADYELPVVVPDWAPDGMVPPLFTDFTFDNLGVPKSDHDLLKDLPTDYGLGGFLAENSDLWPSTNYDYTQDNGKFKVMTLRNIGATAPYAHNGLFETLDEITHFYNTRDVESAGWDAPEVPETVNFDELGDLGLSAEDEAALVAFMMTLTDGQ
jgi:cytochrome c peroxidase